MSKFTGKAIAFFAAAFLSLGAFADQQCGTVTKVEKTTLNNAVLVPYKKVTIGDVVLTVDDTSGWHSIISNALISQVAICINYTNRVVGRSFDGVNTTDSTAGIIDSITLQAR